MHKRTLVSSIYTECSYLGGIYACTVTAEGAEGRGQSAHLLLQQHNASLMGECDENVKYPTKVPHQGRGQSAHNLLQHTMQAPWAHVVKMLSTPPGAPLYKKYTATIIL